MFPEDRFLIKDIKKLDTLVGEIENSFPDLIEIDCQSRGWAWHHQGAGEVLKYCKCLTVELQDTEYNKYAPRATEVIEYLKTIGYDCVAPTFSDNGPDKGYSFWIQN